MILGAAAFCVYAALVCWVGMRWKVGALKTTLTLMPVWFAVSFGGWMLLRATL